MPTRFVALVIGASMLACPVLTFGEQRMIDIVDWVEESMALPPDVRRPDWMSRHPDGRRWIGHRAGTYLVDLAVAASGRSSAELTSTSTDEVIRMALAERPTEASVFLGTRVFSMTNPEGAQETVRIWDADGIVAASVLGNVTNHSTTLRLLLLVGPCLALVVACQGSLRPSTPAWEAENPVRPLEVPPLGMELYFEEASRQPIPELVRLGRWLFFDTRLSDDGTISCASCHRPEYAFSEPLLVPVGIRGQRGTRKTPSIINLAATPRLMGSTEPAVHHLFWDGRAVSLEDQALRPIENPVEMGNTHAGMLATLSEITGYRPYFREVFGPGDITVQQVAMAIADYERTRMSGNSPYDRWRFGGEGDAVSQPAKRGYALFFDRARCAMCHAGSNFTDSRFHNLGVGWDADAEEFRDVGRFAVTGNPDDLGAFKTPGLREVSLRAPYMHDGSLGTLREVVEFYNRGGIENPNRSGRLVPLGLSEDDVDALTAFLNSLEGIGYQESTPTVFPP